MAASSNTAFKEWAVIVDALGRGEQVLILRKGGIHEQQGEFRVQHDRFWLYPTQYHEAEQSVIPSKRPTVREIAAGTQSETVDIQYFAVVEAMYHITDGTLLKRLQGRHIWSDHVLQQRFEFGRAPGLHALVTRVWSRPAPERVPVRENYGGCKSWIELEQALNTDNLTPVMSDTEFSEQKAAIAELLSTHAHAYA